MGIYLTVGHTKSCGCLQREIASMISDWGIPDSSPDMLYVVVVTDPEHNEQYVKVGRTIHSIAKRYGYREYRTLTIRPILTLRGQHRDIKALEMKLKFLRNNGHTEFPAYSPTLKISGHTESYPMSALLRICEFVDDYSDPSV